MKFPVYGLENENRSIFSIDRIEPKDAPHFFESLTSTEGALDYIHEKLKEATLKHDARAVQFWGNERRIKALEVEKLNLQLRVLDLLMQIASQDNIIDAALKRLQEVSGKPSVGGESR